MIVKTENSYVVLADEVQFVLEGRVVLDLPGCVLVDVKRGFVGNDHVLARSDGSLDHVECRHHGDRNPANNRIRISGKNAVDRLRPPWNAHVVANTIY